MTDLERAQRIVDGFLSPHANEVFKDNLRRMVLAEITAVRREAEQAGYDAAIKTAGAERCADSGRRYGNG